MVIENIGPSDEEKEFFNNMETVKPPPIKDDSLDAEEAVADEYQSMWETLKQRLLSSGIIGSELVAKSLWDYISAFFFPIFETVAASLALKAREAIQQVFEGIHDYAEQNKFIQDLQKLDADLLAANTSAELFPILIEYGKLHPIISLPFTAMHALMDFTGLVNASVASKQIKFIQEGLEVVLPSIPDINTAAELVWKKDYQPEIFRDIAAKHGFPEHYAQDLLDISGNYLGPAEIKDLYNRNEIDIDQVRTMLKRLKYGPGRIENIVKLFRVLPFLTDMIRFAVREVYSPDARQTYGLDENFPEEFAVDAAKLGLEEEDAKKYWAAHWELPPINQGFEMFHRDIIDLDAMRLLLRTKDVMPYWRDKIIQLAYKNYTRVDVRRMHGVGVLSDDDVLRSFLDLGYSPDKAEVSAQYVIRYNESDERDITKSDIMGVYSDKIIPRGEAKEFLGVLGFSKETAEMLLSRVDFDEVKRIKKSQKSATKKLYIAGKIGRSQVEYRLTQKDFTGPEIDGMLIEWDIERQDKFQRLSKEDVRKMFQASILSEGETLIELQEDGFMEQDAFRLVKLWKLKKA